MKFLLGEVTVLVKEFEARKQASIDELWTLDQSFTDGKKKRADHTLLYKLIIYAKTEGVRINVHHRVVFNPIPIHVGCYLLICKLSKYGPVDMTLHMAQKDRDLLLLCG